MIPLWKGSTNAWDCDEMGHMNVRVYLEKAFEGLGAFAAAIHMPHAYRANASSTLLPVEQHMRFIRESRPGEPLTMSGCVLEWDDTSALIYQEMRHRDGRPAAAFRTRVFHVAAKTGAKFPWSTRSRAQLEALTETPPEDTRPRSLNLNDAPLPPQDARLETAEKIGAPEIGRGLVAPNQCDVHGRMQAAWFMGRLSDSVPNLLYDWRLAVAASKAVADTGGAVLEYRMVYRKWPRAGDRFVIHTSLAGVTEKTHSLAHWVLDPDTGEAWITSEAVTVTLDLTTRKIIPTPPDQLKLLQEIAPEGLRV
ncbi:MAG: thioesterase family protein [Henriciella sp.]|nr:thioesterase family protein [Henriciella sp.]